MSAAEKNKPATALPWHDQRCSVWKLTGSPEVFGVAKCEQEADAAYIVHACNAYPKAIRAAQRALAALRALGHENVQGAKDAAEILRELGEAE